MSQNEQVSVLEKIRDFLELVPAISNMESQAALIKDFIQSIGQQAVLKQYETAFDEYVQLNGNRHDLLHTLSDIFNRVGKAYRWSPVLGSKHVKLLDWLRELRREATGSGMGINGQTFQNICIDYAKTYNRSFKVSSTGKVAKVAEKAECDFSAEAKLLMLRAEIDALDKSVEELNTRRSIHDHQDDLNVTYAQMEAQILTYLEKFCSEDEQRVLLESFNFVQLQLLNDNLQKWITMESVAVGAKQQLVLLTSRDGDWYLDEMLSLIENCVHLMRLSHHINVKLQTPVVSINHLNSLELVFRSLKELVNEFPLERLMSACFEDPNGFADLADRLNQIDIDGFFASVSRDGFQQFEFLTVIFNNHFYDNECFH